MTTKLTVLGCGGSLGVPNIMGRMGDCDPNNPKNYRTRTSAWVEYNGKNFLIDTSPDLRTQLLREKLVGIRPDAVVYTHEHADHCHGIDDLRAYFYPDQVRVPVYAHPKHIDEFKRRFDYDFFGSGDNGLYVPILEPHEILAGANNIAGEDIEVIQMPHGDTISMGYRFGDIAWTTDFKTIPPDGLAALAGIKIWFAAVADWENVHPSHAILPEILELWEKLGKPQTYLIHLNPRADYAKLDAATPPNVSPAHDGLVVEAG